MDFLVELETRLPPEMPAPDRKSLLARELVHGRELRASGVIDAIWRLPGRLANVGVWRAPDANALHEAIAGLPAWPWMTVTVTVLAEHPLMLS
ncbi:MAG: Muconolactone delta-isomerase [Amycolatopsis sp.]|jgi:muconolactone D-isomerase|uniref:muconolactone Delta-isomerase family protein n=1 Tax=Amycolatopsis sp. TaxID=37632 RepID=UPI002633099D|nr:muconolactone Delta-isomerase family protein [Amycolatopsis sp.]MCU1682320.1 Muconolactone delta-isomerase [Amycolatopsis sp.]